MYTAKNYQHLIGLEGMSEQMLRNHFALYEGYATNVNKLLEQLDAKESGTIEYSEMQRRFGWEFDGMRLHEYYFENIAKKAQPVNENSKLYKLINKIYGSFESWQNNFSAVGSMRGIGWAVLYYDSSANELFNVWINEHDGGHLAGCAPLLVMDVFEHAFMLDYGTKRAGYVDAFMKAIDWIVVEKRFECQRVCQHEKA